MNRRGFLGALAGAVAAAVGGVSWLTTRGPKAEPPPTPAAPSPVLAVLERQLNVALGAVYAVSITLYGDVDRPAVIGVVRSLTSPHAARFSASLFNATPAVIARQIKYQAVKAAQSIEFSRRTGYAMRVVGRPGHRLDGRIYYQHERTGHVRWSRPA